MPQVCKPLTHVNGQPSCDVQTRRRTQHVLQSRLPSSASSANLFPVYLLSLLPRSTPVMKTFHLPRWRKLRKSSPHSKSASQRPPKRTPKREHNEAPDDYEMIKRRIRVPLAILERPLMTETEFLIDARYKSIRLVGSGSYGIVVSAMDTLTKSHVAVKKILSPFVHPHMARHVLREVRLLRHLNHPHIVKLLDIDVPQQYKAWDSVYIVTTLLDTDLKAAMHAGKTDSPRTQKKVAYQMLLALSHMHSLGLMHRDVKSKNLLLDKNMNVQLCDLGESRFYSKATTNIIGEEEPPAAAESEPELTGVFTTMIQSAPEVLLGAEYDAEVDIWAAGCVIAELLHPLHKYLFDSTGKHSHIQEIIDIVGYPSADILELLPDYGVWYLRRMRKSRDKKNRLAEMFGRSADPLAIDLLEKMLKFSPKQRLSAKHALTHPWFDDVRETCDLGDINQETYNFAESEPRRHTSKTALKNLVWEEVVAFHPEAPALGIR